MLQFDLAILSTQLPYQLNALAPTRSGLASIERGLRNQMASALRKQTNVHNSFNGILPAKANLSIGLNMPLSTAVRICWTPSFVTERRP